MCEGEEVVHDALEVVELALNAKQIKEYRQKVELELSNICNDVIRVIDEHLIPLAAAGESTVFYYKM